MFGALRAPHFLLQMPSFPTVKCRTSGPLALRRRPRHRSFTTRFSIPAAGVNQIPPPASPPAHNDVSSDMRRIDTTPSRSHFSDLDDGYTWAEIFSAPMIPHCGFCS